MKPLSALSSADFRGFSLPAGNIAGGRLLAVVWALGMPRNCGCAQGGLLIRADLILTSSP
jgi:hypothetical protein